MCIQRLTQKELYCVVSGWLLVDLGINIAHGQVRSCLTHGLKTFELNHSFYGMNGAESAVGFCDMSNLFWWRDLFNLIVASFCVTYFGGTMKKDRVFQYGLVLMVFVLVLAMSLPALASSTADSHANHGETSGHGLQKCVKPSPAEAVKMLQEGNKRFVTGHATHTHSDSARLIQAGRENQGDHAYATVITCSDSRVPVERIFDAGIMDIFVIRVAGNVIDVDEAGSIEYGLSHVNTPVLVVLGHTQCGAVTAVTAAMTGHGHPLERNIPPLVDNIQPAVQRAMDAYPGAATRDIIRFGIVENVWQGIEDLFMSSPASRELVKNGQAKVVGAIYNVGTGKVKWLPEEQTFNILNKVENNPDRAMNAMAN